MVNNRNGPYTVPGSTAKPRIYRKVGDGMACPRRLHGLARELWEAYIRPCYWLQSPWDEPKAIRAVQLMAAAEKGDTKAMNEATLCGSQSPRLVAFAMGVLDACDRRFSCSYFY
jgi:hypothetical protein